MRSNTIEHELTKDVKNSEYTPFTQLVRHSKRLTPRQRDLLIKWAELRNVIVHTPKGGVPEVIADPRLDIVRAIERQLDLLVKPPRVLEVLRYPPPRALNSDDSIAAFLEEVALPNDFSQSPVRMAGPEPVAHHDERIRPLDCERVRRGVC